MFTLLFFLRAFVGGRDDGCVGAGRDGGFCVLSSAFSSSIFCHILTLQYLWQLNVSQEAGRNVEVHFKANT